MQNYLSGKKQGLLEIQRKKRRWSAFRQILQSLRSWRLYQKKNIVVEDISSEDNEAESDFEEEEYSEDEFNTDFWEALNMTLKD